MAEGYLRCPNCGSQLFYVGQPGAGLVFLRVRADGVPVASKEPDRELSDLDVSTIHCTSCAWYGSISELVP
ncbi:MAG: hypothetical protein KKB20_13675 [Proteobacteria bacterium]|nr:hypothetical protein [Pseudomonadota bacterium]